LSAMRARYIERQLRAPCARQQWRRRTALSNKCGQCCVDSRIDETERRLVAFRNERLTVRFAHNLNTLLKILKFLSGDCDCAYSVSRSRVCGGLSAELRHEVTARRMRACRFCALLSRITQESDVTTTTTVTLNYRRQPRVTDPADLGSRLPYTTIFVQTISRPTSVTKLITLIN